MSTRTRISRIAPYVVVALGAAPAARAQGPFAVTSPDLPSATGVPAAHVFDGFGCTGANRSPALRWSGAPAGTKSFAVTMYNPDAPTGSGWWHWVVYDIPATITSLPTGAGAADGSALPAGAVQGRTDFGKAAYGGPCPPKGDAPHRYVVTVFALGVPRIEVPESSSAAMIGYTMQKNAVATATLTVRHGR